MDCRLPGDELADVLRGAAAERGKRIAAFQRGNDATLRVLRGDGR